MSAEQDRLARARQGRLAAIVIAVSGLGFIGLTWLGEELGWPNRILGLIGLAAMAGFAFGLIVAIRLWLGGRNSEG
ncbi:hypothetical protein GQE99_13290 [Maritimibacter sp. DP07]|jgi:hypothetical protein|uniref:Uncharacterized protein n=1 Tax=Maritimibacter harenae TaxID=2606218 RepID=A0A845M0Y0_9RHOB|nr:DUF5337 domain-containing protein [Maritimibacter harenae]MZR13990.1 hypothetical protein [Maritimibacter harenae]